MNRSGETESTPKKRNLKMEEIVLKNAITKSGRKVKRPAHLESPERAVSATPEETRKSIASKASKADAEANTGTPGKRAAVKEAVSPEKVRPSRKTIASARKTTTEPSGTPKRGVAKEPKPNADAVDEGAGVSKSGRKIKVPVKLMEFESEVLISPRKTLLTEKDEASTAKLTKTPGRPKAPGKPTVSAVEDDMTNRLASKTPGRRTKSVAPNHPEEKTKDTAPAVRTPRRKVATTLFENESAANLRSESPARTLESQPKTPGKRAAKSLMVDVGMKTLRTDSPATEKAPPKTPGRRTKSVAVDKESKVVSDKESKVSVRGAQTPVRRGGRATINVPAQQSREESPVLERDVTPKTPGRRVGKSMINADLQESTPAEQTSVKTPVRGKRAADSTEDVQEDPKRGTKTAGQKLDKKVKQQAEESISETKPVQKAESSTPEVKSTKTLTSHEPVSRSGRKIKPKKVFDLEQDEKAVEPSTVAEKTSLNESGRKRKANDAVSTQTMMSPSKKKSMGSTPGASQTPKRNIRVDGVAESSQAKSTPDGTVSRSGRKIKPKKMFGFEDEEKDSFEHATGSSPTLVKETGAKTITSGTPSKRAATVSVKSVQKKVTNPNELLDEDQLQTHFITKRGVDDHHHQQHHLIDEADCAVVSSDPVILRTSIGFGKPATAKKTPFVDSATVKGEEQKKSSNDADDSPAVEKKKRVGSPVATHDAGDGNVSAAKEKVKEANVTIATDESGGAKVSVGKKDDAETQATKDDGNAKVSLELEEPEVAKDTAEMEEPEDTKISVEMEEASNAFGPVETEEALNQSNSQKENDAKIYIRKDNKDKLEIETDEIPTPSVEKQQKIEHDAEQDGKSDNMESVNNPTKKDFDLKMEETKQQHETNATEMKLESSEESKIHLEKEEVSTQLLTGTKAETSVEQPTASEEKALGETADTPSSDNTSNIVLDAEGSKPVTELQFEDATLAAEASLERQNNEIAANKNESFEKKRDSAADEEINSVNDCCNVETEKNVDESVANNEPKNTSTTLAGLESDEGTKDSAPKESIIAGNNELLDDASFGGIEYLEDEVTNIVGHIKKPFPAHAAANDASILEVSVSTSLNPAIVIIPETPAVTQLNETYSPVKSDRVPSSPSGIPLIDITSDTPRPVVGMAAVAAPRTPEIKSNAQTAKDDCSPDKPPEIIEIMDTPDVASFCSKINKQLVQSGKGGSAISTPLLVRKSVEKDSEGDEQPMEYQLEGRKRSLSASVAETTLKRNVTFHSPANCTIPVETIDERLMLKSLQDQQRERAEQNETNHGTSIGEKLRKPRKRSLSEHKPSEMKRNKVSKLPNFKNIHANHFKRMESIADFMKRKETRAKQILTTASPATKLLARPATATNDSKIAEVSSIEKKEASTSSKPFLFKSTGTGHVPSAGLFSSGTKGASSTMAKATAGTAGPRTIQKPITSDSETMVKRMKQYQTTFKPKQITTDTTIATKSTTTVSEGHPVEQLRSKQTKILKGVRTNRRFELQMKHRDHLQQQ